MSIAVDTSEPSRRSSGEVRKLESLLNHKTMGEEILPERHSTSREQMNRCSYRTKGAPRVLGPPSLPPPGLSGLPAPPAARMMARSGSPSNRCSVVRRRVTQGAHPARAGREPGRLRKGRHAGSPRARRTALPRGFAAPGAESTRRAVRAGLWSHSRYRMGAGAGERYICFSCVPTVHRIRPCILAPMTFECNRNHCLAAGLA